MIIVLKTPSQKNSVAIIIDEDNNYINAGAGCGKTQTMVAKTCFLIEKKNINADEILIFAFNKKAQE